MNHAVINTETTLAADPPADASTASPGNDSADRYVVPGLQRGLHLLAQFNREQRELSGAELSRRMGLPRASVFRLLQTLELMGFVERAGDSANYRLGVAVLRLGFEFLASMELTEQGRPVLDALCVGSGFSAHLVVRDQQEVVFVAKALGKASLFNFINSIQVGARLPAHATVLGRVLLAGLTPEELAGLYAGQSLRAYTAQTPTTLPALQALIEQHRQQGYGISQGGFEAGISTIAAPVFDDRHTVCAAVSVTVPASQIDAAQLPELVAQVQLAAAKLTQRISHLPYPASGTRPSLQSSKANA
jgi:DNA-binding IclR family transcriptional regulator